MHHPAYLSACQHASLPTCMSPINITWLLLQQICLSSAPGSESTREPGHIHRQSLPTRPGQGDPPAREERFDKSAHAWSEGSGRGCAGVLWQPHGGEYRMVCVGMCVVFRECYHVLEIYTFLRELDLGMSYYLSIVWRLLMYMACTRVSVCCVVSICVCLFVCAGVCICCHWHASKWFYRVLNYICWCSDVMPIFF